VRADEAHPARYKVGLARVCTPVAVPSRQRSDPASPNVVRILIVGPPRTSLQARVLAATRALPSPERGTHAPARPFSYATCNRLLS
jgi:hypothetical protein